ncbi:MAG: hypothetical protein ACOC2Q_01115 [Spirochaetota bacterium]
MCTIHSTHLRNPEALPLCFVERRAELLRVASRPEAVLALFAVGAELLREDPPRIRRADELDRLRDRGVVLGRGDEEHIDRSHLEVLVEQHRVPGLKEAQALDGHVVAAVVEARAAVDRAAQVGVIVKPATSISLPGRATSTRSSGMPISRPFALQETGRTNRHDDRLARYRAVRELKWSS